MFHKHGHNYESSYSGKGMRTESKGCLPVNVAFVGKKCVDRVHLVELERMDILDAKGWAGCEPKIFAWSQNQNFSGMLSSSRLEGCAGMN